MNALFTGIYSKFTTGVPAFYTNMGGRLYLVEAPQDSEYPHTVYSMPSNFPEYYFNDEVFEDFIIQFSIFDENKSSVTIGGYLENLKALYDDANITVAAYSTVIFERMTTQIFRHQKDNIWQYTTQYNVTLEKN